MVSIKRDTIMKNKFCDKKKHILHLNLNGTGGAFSLISNYAIVLQDDYIFDFYCLGKFASSEKTDALNKIGSIVYEQKKYRNRFINYLFLPFRFYLFLKKNHYDIIHINSDLSYNMFLYSFPAILAGVNRIVLHSHSNRVNGDHRTLKLFLHFLCKKILISKHFIRLACSDSAKKWMFQNNQKVTILKNSINLIEFKFNAEKRLSIRTKLGIEDKIVICMVGDMSFAKNPEFILDVLSKIPNRQNYVVLFVGDGVNRNKIKKLSSQLNVDKNCIFLGQQSEVCDILSASDIFVMPSRFEGFGLSAIEAQANGLPSFLSDQIPYEVKVLDSCKFLPIDSRNIWIEQLKNCVLEKNRIECNDKLLSSGYDVRKNANQLKKIYSPSY